MGQSARTFGIALVVPTYRLNAEHGEGCMQDIKLVHVHDSAEVR
jgi:hypothetical protein